MTEVTTRSVGVDLVVAGCRVPLIRVGAEILVGETEVGLVCVEISAAQFQLKRLVICRVRFPRQLDHRLAAGETGFTVGAFQILEAIRRTIVTLDEVTDATSTRVLFAAVINVAHHLVEFTVVNFRVSGDFIRNRSGQVVDRATGGVRTVLHLAGTLYDLEATHALQGRAVIGRRRGVRGRGGEDTVLHDSHL